MSYMYDATTSPYAIAQKKRCELSKKAMKVSNVEIVNNEEHAYRVVEAQQYYCGNIVTRYRIYIQDKYLGKVCNYIGKMNKFIEMFENGEVNTLDATNLEIVN